MGGPADEPEVTGNREKLVTRTVPAFEQTPKCGVED
jgi:hypothetical protein